MNRSVLIVICDFLLVSLLAFSTVDINKVADEGAAPQVKVDIATNQVDNGKDLAAQKCAGFITTLQRGVEWAATGKVTQQAPSDFPTAEKVSLREN